MFKRILNYIQKLIADLFRDHSLAFTFPMIFIRVLLVTPLWQFFDPRHITWYIHFAHLWVGILIGMACTENNPTYKRQAFIATLIEIVLAIVQAQLYGQVLR